jgi:hypothetical protein
MKGKAYVVEHLAVVMCLAQKGMYRWDQGQSQNNQACPVLNGCSGRPES